ncbi:MAG TPA: elongation factor G [Anaerolineae bacterium]|nr:elongation factor G [Anaerolineae bacterium]
MPDSSVARLRNIVLVSHGGAGKTSLSEAMLFNSGAINRLGRVDEGTTVSDYDPEEVRRKFSVNTAILPCEWAGHKINVLDTPGYMDFQGEVKAACRVADAAVVVVEAAAGVEVGTELDWAYLDEQGLPRLVFVNKMDRENANWQQALDQLRDKFSTTFVAVQIPIGAQASFAGYVDLVTMQAHMGPEGTPADIPADVAAQAAELRQSMMETAAESDDELVMKYLDGQELTAEEVQRGLAAAARSGRIVPVLCGSAAQNIGVRALLDALVAYEPDPAGRPAVAQNPATGEEETLTPGPDQPFAALVYKTMADPFVGKLTYFRVYSGSLHSDSRVYNPGRSTEERVGQLYMIRGKEQVPVDQVRAGDMGAVAKLQVTNTGDTLCDRGHPLLLAGIEFPKPVFSAAVFPKTKTDLDKMGPGLGRLTEEDPTLRVHRDADTNETILSGMGESHVEIAVRRLHAKFGVEIATDVPKIPYRETITKTASAQGRHKKQTGGRGQFGDVFVRFEPLPRGAGFEFADEVFGGAVPKNFIPAVEKGLREAILKGVVAGYPTVDIKAALYDGSYHPVDSSEIAFKLAAHLAFEKGIAEAGPVLLEPVMSVTITVPDQFMGDILGDLNTRRARVQGMGQERGKSVVTAEVPLAEMQRYATSLRAITQGRGLFTMEFSHYEEVPSHTAQGVIEAARKAKEAEKA